MKIAFCKFAGLANGGVEKYLQTIAIILKKQGHEIDYYYTNAAPITTTSWVHPDNDENRIKLMSDNDIKLIKINVGHRVNNEWVDTDFFDKFDEDQYECLITGGNGESEFPYNQLKKIKIIHTVHGEHSFNQENIVKSVLLCNWQSNKWLNNGGDPSKLEIIPSIVYTPEIYTKTLRERYNITSDAFVYGFHQRNDNSISSSVSLEAYSCVQDDNTYFAILGGADIHRNYVKSNNLKNVIFVDYTSSVNDIHDFLDGIDVYAHCRLDGEVCSASIIEAMYHKKPLISFPGVNMGHLEQLANCGRMVYTIDDYKNEMINLKNKEYYNNMSDKVKNKYDEFYDYKVVEEKILKIIKSL
jgi:glycosyltransferase involved in cell wall biosynthesis